MSSASVDLCTVPLGKRPDGTWDLVHVESQQKIGIMVCVLFTVLALLIALPRLYVNRRQLQIADRQSHCTPYFPIVSFFFSLSDYGLTFDIRLYNTGSGF